MIDLFKIIQEQKRLGIRSALCIIVSTKGSTPLKTGAKMLVTQEGKIYGTIGGGNFEKKVIENALDVIAKNEPRQFEHNLIQQHGMCCGGTVHVYIDTIMPPEKLYIFGSGHVGRALSNYATSLSFEVYVIDDRLEEINQIQNKEINKLVLPYTSVMTKLPFDDQTYVAIMTYDHQIDREILAYCLKKKTAYLGMIGSKRKVEITRKMFLSTELFSEEELGFVDMPMGYNLNAIGPEEIAISILAKLIEVKNKKILKSKQVVAI